MGLREGPVPLSDETGKASFRLRVRLVLGRCWRIERVSEGSKLGSSKSRCKPPQRCKTNGRPGRAGVCQRRRQEWPRFPDAGPLMDRKRDVARGKRPD